MTRSPVSETRHVPSLDGLRGLAACIVFFSHTSNLTNLWNGRLGAGAGQIGVMLFFVLSGYLMGALYLDRPFTSANVWNYAVHRIARVAPLFYLVLITATLLGKVGDALHVDLSFYEIGNLSYSLLFLSGTDVFWTIPVEIQFYTIFVAIWWLHSKSKILAIGFFVTMTVLMIYVNMKPFSDRSSSTQRFSWAAL